MVNTISQILKITKEEDLLTEFESFESSLYVALEQLSAKLHQSIISTDAGLIQNHMCTVESWRDRVTKFNALTSAFVEHAKGTYFILPSGKGVTAVEKEAHQKKLLAGFIGLRCYTEELIKSVDSRVNLCKKLMGIELDGSSFNRTAVN